VCSSDLGFLELPWVMAAAFSGSLLGDQLAFFIGGRWGRRIVARFPGWTEKIEKIRQKTGRYLDLWMLTFRFFWGLRNPTPFVLAMSNVPLARFATLNAIGALVWAVAGAGAGYLCGHAVERFLGDMHKYSLQILGGAVGLWLLVMFARSWYKRRKMSDRVG
jgi:membrane protein DedA with SNARE-associated domain